tara:strand:- start:2802 stop:3146 length:345 start_codon:yes stop_codon:yes gene_type:complete
MTRYLARIFGLTTKKEVDDLRAQVYGLTQQMRKISNIIGSNTKTISDLVYASSQNRLAEKKNKELLDNLVKSFAELALEVAMSYEGLQSSSGRKNIGVGLPSLFSNDDDDDLIN